MAVRVVQFRDAHGERRVAAVGAEGVARLIGGLATTYDLAFAAIREGVTPDHNNRVMPFGSFANAEKYFANSSTVQEDKEILTAVTYPGEKVPSFFQLLNPWHKEF